MSAPALRVMEAQLYNYRRTWKGTAITTFVNPTLYLLAIGLVLGALVDRGAAASDLPGGGYLEFLAPGVLAATAMQVAAADCSWPVLAGLNWFKTYDAALATPVSHRDLVTGHFGWVTVRLTLASIAYVVVMTLLGAAGPARSALSVLPSVLTGLAFAGAITALAAGVRNDQHMNTLFRFAIMPMFLFSGTFFPVEYLPAVLRPLAFLTPLWHGVQLTRASALGLETAWPALAHVGYLVGWFAVGYALSVRFYARKLLP